MSYISRLMILCITFLVTPCSAQSFTLITVLYNEKHQERMHEYITCLEHNLAHPLIEHIHVLYDVSKDDGNNELLRYLQSKPISITYIHDRPTYGFCFDLANQQYPNRAVILSNADIYFNQTLTLLQNYDLTGKFLACTRYDVQADGSLQIFAQYKDGVFDDFGSYLSQDVWMFTTPLRAFPNPHFQMGTWACDGYIACQAYLSGLQVMNPCLSIECCHLHQSNVRSWIPQSVPGAKALCLPWCTLE